LSEAGERLALGRDAGVDWPKTYQCVLTYHTCFGAKTVRSSVRPGGTGMCADYWAVHDALAQREICCDQEKREKPAGGTAPQKGPRDSIG
jgi:hypothetical protein